MNETIGNITTAELVIMVLLGAAGTIIGTCIIRLGLSGWRFGRIAGEIVENVPKEFPQKAVTQELRRMKNERLVDWEGLLRPNAEIKLMRH